MCVYCFSIYKIIRFIYQRTATNEDTKKLYKYFIAVTLIYGKDRPY